MTVHIVASGTTGLVAALRCMCDQHSHVLHSKGLPQVSRVDAGDALVVVRLDGQPAVSPEVYRDAGANTVRVTREMERTLEPLRGEVHAVGLTVVAEQAGFVVEAARRS